MPIYEYSCRKGHRFERMQSFTEKALRKCPRCGSKAERLISGASVIFRGSGWYCKDSRSGSGKNAGKKETPEKNTTAAA